MKRKGRIFTDAQRTNFIAYGEILQRIHDRLISEGWTIKDGVFTNKDGVSYTRDRTIHITRKTTAYDDPKRKAHSA